MKETNEAASYTALAQRVSRLVRLQQSSQCGIGLMTDNQINETEQSPKIEPPIDGQMIIKEQNAVQWRKRSLYKKVLE